VARWCPGRSEERIDRLTAGVHRRGPQACERQVCKLQRERACEPLELCALARI
jgi:hypothetical protein